jgi:type I restriction enzyme S subunit
MSDFKRISEIAKVRRGASPRPIDDPKWFGGKIGWVRIIDVTRAGRYLRATEQYLSTLGEARSVRVDKGDLIMSICATIGRPVIVDMPACIHDGFVQFYDIKGAKVEYLYYALQFAEHGFVGMGQHGTQANLNTTIVENHVLFVPTIPEQSKIAKILMTVDNLIEKTEALIDNYQAIKQGMMHDLFTRGVDKNGHLRPAYQEAPDLYKSSELGPIPKEWKTCRVDEVGSVRLGRQRSPKHQSGRFTTPYLRVANVFDGFIDYSDVLEMDFTPTEKDTYSLLPGDILLNEGQSLELVGRSAIYEGEPHRYCFQNTLIRFRAYPPNDPHFCRGMFKYFIDIGRFMTIARQTTSVAHLGADRLAKLSFPCPHPDEQRRIVKALLQYDKRYDIERKYKSNLVQQKTGLMQDLLTGKVRVKGNESEESTAYA